MQPGRPGLVAWRQHLSLRARLLAVVTGLLVVALVVISAASLAVLKDVLVGEKDAELRSAMGDPQGLVAGLRGQVRGRGRGPTQFYLLVDSQGTRLEIPPEQYADHPPELGDDDIGQRSARTVTSEDGSVTWRVLTISDEAGDDSTTRVTLGLPMEDVDRTVRRLTTALLLIGIAVVAACALLGWVAVQRGFRPLRQVEDVATAFGAGDTSRRVRNAWPGTEVGRLGSSVNAMLDRIETTLAAREASESRMRRFVGDASHELRTPLAAVRGFAELYRMGAAATADDVRHTFRRIEDESTRMGGIVDDLLLLARMDERRPMRRDPVDVLVLAADAVHDARALAPDRVVTLRGPDGAPGPAAAPTVGDDGHLRQVVTNLLANAIRHTPAGTPIEVGVGRQDDWVLLQVVDHGRGIPPEQAAAVFERFYRSDSSRTRSTGGGSGLGLAIVEAIVTAHAGVARVVPTPGGGATFEVALPAPPP